MNIETNKSSTLSANFIAMQRYCGISEVVSTTDFRKAITTSLRRPLGQRSDCDEVGDVVASALCHTRKTNDLHYNIGNKDEEALSVHKAILDLMR